MPSPETSGADRGRIAVNYAFFPGWDLTRRYSQIGDT